jgi:isopentenyldiphosphate isomerase
MQLLLMALQAMKDNEFTQTFAMAHTSTEAIVHDPAEVAETAYWKIADVLNALQHEPERLTSWFRAELAVLDLHAVLAVVSKHS